MIQVGFASAYETGNIDYLRVHKADGTTVETPVADAIEMPAPVTTVAPLYSDLKVKQLPVRSLSAGDVIDYQLRTVRTKAEVPDQFWGAEHFLRDAGVVLSQTLALEVPVDTYVQVWDPNHSTTPKRHEGVRTYSWSASQLTPTGSAKGGSAQSAVQKINDPDEDAEGRRLPSVAWTTFHSWAEVGTWYRGLALERDKSPYRRVGYPGLGLFQEGKPAEAEPYIRAAWFTRIDVVVGDHLSQVLEALQKKSEALTTDQLALASAGTDNNGEECAAIRKNIERLQRDRAAGTVQDATRTVRDMRTFRVQRPAATEGSGIFFGIDCR